jgi:hypothetical protein
VYGGQLTAMLLPEKQYVSVPARRAYLKFKQSRTLRPYGSSDDDAQDGSDNHGVTPDTSDFAADGGEEVQNQTPLDA